MLRIILVALLIVIAALCVLVYFLRPEPPRMPDDVDHRSSRNEKDCLSCHGPGEKSPRKPTHPNANDCFRCHTILVAGSMGGA